MMNHPLRTLPFTGIVHFDPCIIRESNPPRVLLVPPKCYPTSTCRKARAEAMRNGSIQVRDPHTAKPLSGACFISK